MNSYAYNLGLAYGRIAELSAGMPALRFATETISHGQLNALANRLAAVLSCRTVARGDVVAIVHTKTERCFAAMIACLKLGAPYVNVDDQNPTFRVERIFDTCNPILVVGESIPAQIAIVARARGIATLALAEMDDAALNQLSDSEPPNCRDVIGSDPAYIMYTSGSTGVPKGAVISHASVLNLVAWGADRFDVSTSDVFSNVNPMYFDNSVFDFYVSILNGASLVPVTREAVAQPSQMIAQLEAAGCTVWFSVPSLLIYLGTLRLLNFERLPTVRAFIFGGEGYPKPELRKLFGTYSARSRLVNVYGPTECTCICSAYDVTAADLEGDTGLVTLGPLAANFRMVLLGSDGVVAGPGVTGELCLGGPQVGLGYINDVDRTAAAFLANPTGPAWHDRVYRTGDLVTVGADGRSLNFVGRVDNQVKHMGYRIELEEIEAAINSVEGISQSAVLLVSGRRDLKRLVAYLASDRERNDQELRGFLSERLPAYMIPQEFFLRSSLPKNSNGKVDRIALRAETEARNG